MEMARNVALSTGSCFSWHTLWDNVPSLCSYHQLLIYFYKPESALTDLLCLCLISRRKQYNQMFQNTIICPFTVRTKILFSLAFCIFFYYIYPLILYLLLPPAFNFLLFCIILAFSCIFYIFSSIYFSLH